tara:strand:+ start:534 stop:944 length:411 start_codon:yes stop_codon:yes gene_type:complete
MAFRRRHKPAALALSDLAATGCFWGMHHGFMDLAYHCGRGSCHSHLTMIVPSWSLPMGRIWAKGRAEQSRSRRTQLAHMRPLGLCVIGDSLNLMPAIRDSHIHPHTLVIIDNAAIPLRKSQIALAAVALRAPLAVR